jgi:adenosylcobinamide amidohydrolase
MKFEMGQTPNSSLNDNDVDLKQKIPIDGVRAEIKDNCLLVHSEKPLKVLTSNHRSQGYDKYSWIINKQVPLDSDHSKLDQLLEKNINKMGLPKHTLGFVTAAKVENAVIISERQQNLTVSAAVTAGVHAAATAGDKATEKLTPHTVNTIVIIDSNLSVSGMVSAVITATEAKTVVFRELNIKSFISGEIATGTASDAIAVACTGIGKQIAFAGTGSKLGELIGRTVRQATKTCLQKTLK